MPHDPAFTQLFTRELESRGCTTTCALWYGMAFQMLRTEQPSVIVLDLSSTDMQIAPFLEELHREQAAAPVVPIVVVAEKGIDQTEYRSLLKYTLTRVITKDHDTARRVAMAVAEMTPSAPKDEQARHE